MEVEVRRAGGHLAPRPAPALTDGGIALTPFAGLAGGERLLGSLGVDGAVNALQGACQRLAMLPEDEVHRVPEKVHDASLDDRFWEHSGDRIREALGHQRRAELLPYREPLGRALVSDAELDLEQGTEVLNGFEGNQIDHAAAVTAALLAV